MLVDLHLHTTASDGRSTPAELVALAAAAGVTVLAVTDHDTVASWPDVASAAREQSIEAIAAIEITAVEDGRDVHMLGYFIETADTALAEFLAAQRRTRLRRVERIAERLAELGMPVDVRAYAGGVADAGRSIGRPQVADAMIAAGYVRDRREAFDAWLGNGKPGFIPRDGATPEHVIEIVHDVNGVVSLAHPGRTGLDDARIRRLVAAGLDAIEVYHPDHDEALVQRYATLADQLKILRTGGSDFHGDPAHGLTVGTVSLPPEQWVHLMAAAPSRN